ncbi:indole-3-glycerol phosphate synthase TrpC [Xanthocytophaga flava]|uniref:indole-3-glycerol phosphate synthase TrpC n=1 Tax=Xanthocytophaga flava TaxID=3048013 RepID=UPI0028D7AA78|nr:indole-3-glycerol phosphate synthase TrpC [Xanthocytophaga flavus]MDJ1469807.1 indole-3-glycerol phosphate synthase TrpC [Xanthocytophaga flavus]
MNILDEIIAHKKGEVAERKSLTAVSVLEKSDLFGRKTVSLRESLLNPEKSGIIAEHKRKSPSKGIINQQVSVEQVTTGYTQGGASALSVLTDQKYFDGKDEHILRARKANPDIPILRKDFVIDEYQLIEAKSLGADIILLIAANLTPDQCKQLAKAAKALTLEVLLEVHNLEELESSVNEYIDVIGVNNRDLKRMKTDINISKELSERIPREFLKISESGIHLPEVLQDLRHNYGYNGFLIGEYFMQHSDPGVAFSNFVADIKQMA